jgi:hypothetical protein
MEQLIEITAARIGAVIQDVCAKVDFEVVSLPGGSLIALFLCLYGIAMSSVQGAATQYPASTSSTEAPMRISKTPSQ